MAGGNYRVKITNDIELKDRLVAINRVARDVADQVIFMDDGYILEQGDPYQVFEHPKEERTRQFLSRFHDGE